MLFATLVVLLLLASSSTTISLQCPQKDSSPLKFHLVRECQRALTVDALTLENTNSLEECIQLARNLRGLALNYAPSGKRRLVNRFGNDSAVANSLYLDKRRGLTVFEQPGEFFNCHVLECPQNISFAGMVNDSRFDYYSLYGRPIGLQNYSCVPQVGLFVMYSRPSSYLNASVACSNSSEFHGSLAHIASETRTRALAKWMINLNKIFLAYVGLKYNRSISLSPSDYRNAQQESLQCFLYRAWEVGHPQRGGLQLNSSCVGLTPQGSWLTLSCERELPFICEIFTSISATNLDVGPSAVTKCELNE